MYRFFFFFLNVCVSLFIFELKRKGENKTKVYIRLQSISISGLCSFIRFNSTISSLNHHVVFFFLLLSIKFLRYFLFFLQMSTYHPSFTADKQTKKKRASINRLNLDFDFRLLYLHLQIKTSDQNVFKVTNNNNKK